MNLEPGQAEGKVAGLAYSSVVLCLQAETFGDPKESLFCAELKGTKYQLAQIGRSLSPFVGLRGGKRICKDWRSRRLCKEEISLTLLTCLSFFGCCLTAEGN